MSTTGRLAYPIHRRTLDNGLRVIVSPDHNAPVVAVNLWYDVGSRDETVGRTGFAHLFEHLMFQGSAHVASGEHLNLLQANGASCNATTWFDRTNYFETVPSGVTELALWLEADRMAHLLDAVNDENLANQRDVVKEEKRQRYDNAPYGDMIEHLLTLSFPPDHPYGHTVIGSMADLDAAGVSDVHAFFTTWYAPGNAVLTLVGDIEPAEAFALAARHFGALPTRALPTRPTVATLGPHAGVPRIVTSADVPADALYLAFRTPPAGTREADAAELALEVLGGSETSRLHRRLVLGDQTCSTAGAGVVGLARSNSLGFALARALDGADLAAVENAACAEFERFAADGPTDEELARVRVQYERHWLSECARVEARADLISGFTTQFDDPDRVNSRLADYTALTTGEIRGAARAWLRPEHRAVLEYHRAPRAEACEEDA
ncbi:pitrilysin family protein [Propioniciclava sp.]|uniref:M16 family metallopeptidase n=1 Tax=Propioniciclava sp. TaxID=2038686 RepID=UPI00260D942E|nr:pitrilysin family protein [Propioniciclava sp.]